MAKQRLTVLLFFTGLTLIFFLPFLFHLEHLLWPASGLGSDVAYINWPLQTYYIDRLRAEGAFPLWDSRFMLGLPLAGDPHILWLYPLNLILLWLPTTLALNLFVVFHVLLAGLGMYALLRRGFHTSVAAAVLGALAFMFMPKLMAQSMGGVLAFGLAWVPLVWLGARLAAVEGHRLGGALGGAALALLSPLHIQITYYAAATSIAYFAWLVVSLAISRRRAGERLDARHIKRALLALGAFLLSFLLLAAPLWLPLIEILPYTSRQSFTVADASLYQLPAPLLATLVAPSQFQFPEWMMFLGVVPVVLAAAAWLGPRRGDSAFFLALALFALAYALGTQTPLFGLVFHTVPGAGLLRVPTRLWALGGAAVAVMAGLGAEALDRPRVAHFLRHHQRALRLAGVVYFVALAAALAGVSALAGQFQGQVLVVMLVAAGLTGMGWAYTRGRLPRAGLHAGLCLAMLVDLMPLTRTFFTLENPAASFLSSSPALDFVAAQPGLFRVYSTHKDLNYAAAAARGVETLDGALSFQIEHTVEIIKAATGCELEGFATGVPPCLTSEIDKDAYRRAQPRAALLGLLNVRYVVSSFPLTDPALVPVLEAASVTVYANDKWLPRAFVVGRLETVTDEETSLARLRESDPAQVAYAAGAATVQTAATTAAPVTVSERRSGYYRLETAGAGWLILSETWAPGWRARLNGTPAPVLRVNSALLGVSLPPGQHTVELEYLPFGWRVGWPLLQAGLAWLALWALGLGAQRLLRRRGTAP